MQKTGQWPVFCYDGSHMERKIILASQSDRRKALLEQLGLEFSVHPSEYEEEMELDMDDRELVKYLSLKKAEDVVRHYEDAIVIGADVFVVFNGERMGKPITPERATEMLQSFSGKEVPIICGFTVIDTKTGKTVSRCTETIIHFKKMSDEEIAGYVATGEPLQVAGAHKIQGKAAALIEKIDGDFYTVVGLPACELVKVLREFGVSIF